VAKIIKLFRRNLRKAAPVIGENDAEKVDSYGQCYKTFYGRNYVAIGVTQSKS
jgi:hypothetical protein